jgi:hypothetical protein
MKRFVVFAVLVLLIGVAVGAYYYSAWYVARDAAIAIAAGDAPQPPDGSPWALGSSLPHDRLLVSTHAGWYELASHLAVPFTVTDRITKRSVDFAVDVQFTGSGWQIVGAGSGG